MTAFTDTKSVEARKAISSQEVAAYTRRQRDMVCRAIEDGSRRQAIGQPSQQQESASVSPDSGTSPRHRHGTRGRSPNIIRSDSLRPRGRSAGLCPKYSSLTGTSMISERWLLERHDAMLGE